MAKGKYAARANRSLQVLESEKVRELAAKNKELAQTIADQKHELDTMRAQIDSIALRTAEKLSAREKTYLRNKLEQTEIDHRRFVENAAKMLFAFSARAGIKAGADSPVKADDICFVEAVDAALGLPPSFVKLCMEMEAASEGKRFTREASRLVDNFSRQITKNREEARKKLSQWIAVFDKTASFKGIIDEDVQKQEIRKHLEKKIWNSGPPVPLP